MNCSICYDHLFTSQEAPAALVCGHVFHKTCVDACLRRKKECPLCRKPVRPQKDVTQLFLTFTEDTQSAPSTSTVSSSTDMTAITNQLTHLQSKHRDLQQLYQKMAAERNQVEDKLKKQNEEVDKLKAKLERRRRQHDYFKTLKRVADLDKDLATRSAQLYMKSKENDTRDKLLLENGALYQLYQKSERMNNDLIQRNSILLRQLERASNHNVRSPVTVDSNNLICISDDDDDDDIVEIIEDSNNSSLTPTQTPTPTTTTTIESSTKDRKLKRKCPDLLLDDDTQDEFVIREDTPKRIPVASRFAGKRPKMN